MSANPVVDPAQLERLRHVVGCGALDSGGYGHVFADTWSDECDACLALLAAAVEEQTIERCASVIEVGVGMAMDDAAKAVGPSRTEAPTRRLIADIVIVLRSLPRRWGSTPEEAR